MSLSAEEMGKTDTWSIGNYPLLKSLLREYRS